MTSPAGSYGVDAPWVPWMWVGYAVLYGFFTVMAATTWHSWPIVVALLAIATAAWLVGAALYWHTTFRGKFVLWRRQLDAVTLPPDGRVLDLGCGRAAVAIMVAERFPDATVTGIDLWRSIDQSGNSADAARRNAELNDLADRIRFDTGDMTALPYGDGEYDLVTAGLSIHNIASRDGRSAAIQEAARVLAPDGRIVIIDIRRTGEYAQELTRLGFDVAREPLGWLGWWSGPWVATSSVVARRV